MKKKCRKSCAIVLFVSALIISPQPFRHCHTPTHDQSLNNLTPKHLDFFFAITKVVGLFGHPKAAQFDSLQVGQNVRNDIPTHELPPKEGQHGQHSAPRHKSVDCAPLI
jgi:hypothetical protein